VRFPLFAVVDQESWKEAKREWSKTSWTWC